MALFGLPFCIMDMLVFFYDTYEAASCISIVGSHMHTSRAHTHTATHSMVAFCSHMNASISFHGYKEKEICLFWYLLRLLNFFFFCLPSHMRVERSFVLRITPKHRLHSLLEMSRHGFFRV